MTSVVATGKVKKYQSIVGGILLAILPISYIVLKIGGNPESVYIVHLSVCIIAFITRLYIIKPMIQLNLNQYVKEVIIKCLTVSLVALIMPLILTHLIDKSITSFILICISCVVSVSVSTYYLGFDLNERHFIDQKIISVINKFRR